LKFNTQSILLRPDDAAPHAHVIHWHDKHKLYRNANGTFDVKHRANRTDIAYEAING